MTPSPTFVEHARPLRGYERHYVHELRRKIERTFVFFGRGLENHMLSVAYNAAVERPRAAASSAPQAHNELARLRRARDSVSRSAPTACYTSTTDAKEYAQRLLNCQTSWALVSGT